MRKLLILVFVFWTIGAIAQDEEAQAAQDRETAAMDATATQWSFQLAYQMMPDYHNDLVNGEPRKPGLDNYLQLRIVAPIPLKTFTILPRLTIRHYENVYTQKSGLGNTELFALIVPKFSDWGTGRAGIGPLVTMPGNPDVAKDQWGYGFAAAIVNSSGQWFYGVLLSQSWKAVDPDKLSARAVDPNAGSPGESDVNPLGIAPFLAYRFGTTGLYLQSADIVALYDWTSKKFYLPLGLRFGKVWVFEKSSLNVYAEYRTSAVYKDWEGPAVKNSYRFNVTYTIPLGF